MTEIREGTEIGHASTVGYVLLPAAADRIAYSGHVFPTQQDAAESPDQPDDWTVCALIPVALLDGAP